MRFAATARSWVPISSAEPARPEPHLAIEGVQAGYGPVPIVKGVDLSVGMGEVVAIVGPNGAGKSTLLKAITGIIPVRTGRVALGGRDMTNERQDRVARRGVGYVPQVNDVFPNLSVVENLEMGGYLLPIEQLAPRMDAVMSVFPALALMRDRHALKLSGGERKMVAFGRVLMLQPSLLVLDEPTSGLSPELSRVVLREHVRRLADTGAAVLLVEQKAAEALQVADWAYVLVAGEVVISSPAAGLAAREDLGEVFLGKAARMSEESDAGSGRLG